MKRLLFLFLVFFSLPAFAQGTHRVSEVLTRGQGVTANIVPFAKIRVCVAGTNCATLQTVYSDIGLTQVKPQPLTADADGNFDYYVAPGCYDEQYSAPGIPASIRKDVCTGSTTGIAPAGTVYGQTQLRNTNGTALAAIAGAGYDTNGNSFAPKSVYLGGTTPTTNNEVVGSYAANGGTTSTFSANTSVNSNVTTGGGRTIGNQFAMLNNGWGRSVGPSPTGAPASASSWNTSSSQFLQTNCWTPGICEQYTNRYNHLSPGDANGTMRSFLNGRPGGKVANSDENYKLWYAYFALLNNYTGTINAGSTGTGLSSIRTTSTAGGCGANNSNLAFCYGAQLPIINTTVGPVYTGTVSAMVAPTISNYGTFTVSSSPALTVTPYGRFLLSPPDTTNFAAGSSFTASITISAGTPATSGLACINGPYGPGPETVSYTLSGTTITVSGHRYYQGTDNPSLHPVYIFFGACRAFIDIPDATIEGRKAIFWVLGAIDSQTLAWTSSNGGARDSSSLGQPQTSFRPGVTNYNTFSVYDTAKVIAAFDPANGPGTDANGYMALETNNMTFNLNDTIEELYEPAGNLGVSDQYATGDVFSANTWNGITVGSNFRLINDIVLNNPIAPTIAGSGVRSINPDSILQIRSHNPATQGVYNNFANLNIAPQSALFAIGCQAGDSSGSCSNGTPYPLFRMAGANGGGKIIWNPKYGALDFTLSNRLAFSDFTTSNAYIGGTSGANNALNFVKSSDALNNWNGSCPSCTQTMQRSAIQMVDPIGYNSSTDLVLGTPTYVNGTSVPIVTSNRDLWLGALHSTTMVEGALLTAAYHQSALYPIATYTGSVGLAVYAYYYVPLYPNGVYGRAALLRAQVINAATTLNGSNFVLVSCPAAIESGYPSGTTYHVIRQSGSSSSSDLGNCPVGASSTITDTGGGSVLPGSPTAPFSLNASADVDAGRHLTNPLGVFGWYNGYDTTTSAVDTGISRTNPKTVAIGNGTQGDTSGTIQAATGTFGTSLTVGGNAVCTVLLGCKPNAVVASTGIPAGTIAAGVCITSVSTIPATSSGIMTYSLAASYTDMNILSLTIHPFSDTSAPAGAQTGFKYCNLTAASVTFPDFSVNLKYFP